VPLPQFFPYLGGVIDDVRHRAERHSGSLRNLPHCYRRIHKKARRTLTMTFIPKADDLGLGIQAQGGNAKINTLQVHELNSIWK
jgi:hypothetical protein